MDMPAHVDSERDQYLQLVMVTNTQLKEKVLSLEESKSVEICRLELELSCLRMEKNVKQGLLDFVCLREQRYMVQVCHNHLFSNHRTSPTTSSAHPLPS